MVMVMVLCRWRSWEVLSCTAKREAMGENNFTKLRYHCQKSPPDQIRRHIGEDEQDLRRCRGCSCLTSQHVAKGRSGSLICRFKIWIPGSGSGLQIWIWKPDLQIPDLDSRFQVQIPDSVFQNLEAWFADLLICLSQGSELERVLWWGHQNLRLGLPDVFYLWSNKDFLQQWLNSIKWKIDWFGKNLCFTCATKWVTSEHRKDSKVVFASAESTRMNYVFTLFQMVPHAFICFTMFSW